MMERLLKRKDQQAIQFTNRLKNFLKEDVYLFDSLGLPTNIIHQSKTYVTFNIAATTEENTTIEIISLRKR